MLSTRQKRKVEILNLWRRSECLSVLAIDKMLHELNERTIHLVQLLTFAAIFLRVPRASQKRNFAQGSLDHIKSGKGMARIALYIVARPAFQYATIQLFSTFFHDLFHTELSLSVVFANTIFCCMITNVCLREISLSLKSLSFFSGLSSWRLPKQPI